MSIHSPSPPANLPRARKDQTFYLDVWRHRLCGFNANQIAQGLNITAPTVRRALKNISAIQAPETYRILAHAAQEARVPEFLDYDHFMAVMLSFYNGVQNTDFASHHACLSKCDMRGHPRAFVNKHVRYMPIQLGEYGLNFIEFIDIQEATADIASSRRCRYCPLGKYRDDTLAVFQSNPYLYAYLMVELASLRQRNMDEPTMLKRYFDAGSIYLIHQIILNTGQRASLSGDTGEQSMEKMKTTFLNLTHTLWDEILKAA